MKMFTKDKSKDSSKRIKSLLSFRIEKLRTDMKAKKMNPNVSDSAFEKLAIYCFTNLEIPNTHKQYIGENLMSRKEYLKGFDTDIAIEYVKSKNYKDLHGDNLELLLRSIEVLIDYNEENLSYEKMFCILDNIFNFYQLKD